MDNILIFGLTKEKLDAPLESTLNCIQEVGVTLNPAKCQFGKTELKLLGHLINEKRIQPDPGKTMSIAKMLLPKCVKEFKRFLGMANHLEKYSPHLAESSQPFVGCSVRTSCGFGMMHKTIPSTLSRQN